MTPTRGYYSVVQYCPDASRLEAANIGVVLLCPDIGFVRARTAAGNDRVRRFFSGQSIDLDRVNAAKRAIVRRVEIEGDSLRTPEDLIRFMDTRGNDIVLTPPRPVKVVDPEKEIGTLFDELVGGRVGGTGRRPLLPELDRIFRRPSLESRVLFDQRVEVPVLHRPLRAPYAYRNGVTNLVKPQRFGPDDKHATTAAIRLAVEGDLLRRHPVGDEQHRLIVVPVTDASASTTGLEQRVDSILGEYDVQVVHRHELADFAREVENTAHA